jgi:Zn-dependent protease with chaperone function
MSAFVATPRIRGVMKRPALLLARATIAVASALSIVSVRADDDDVHVYRLHDIATQSDDAELRAEATQLEAIYAELERVSGVEAMLLYSTSPDINAFATYAGEEKVVVVEAGFVEYAKEDRDAVAAALGHELGHHKADHIRGGQRKRQGVRVLGAILGAVVGAKVGAGGAIVSDTIGAGAGLVALKFNRDQELEADRLSVDWLIQAGYNPQGMLRLQQKLAELEKEHPHSAILSTHPTSAKRYAAAEKLIAKRAPSADLLARAQAPLVDERALASVNAEINRVEDARVAEVLKPSATPAAALLDSGQGMSLADYAALSNELVWAGKDGEGAALKRHKLTAIRWQQISDTFDTRMRTDPSMADYFKVRFFRATQGRYAEYGRDLADSYEKGQPLKLEPPLSIEEFGSLAGALGGAMLSADEGNVPSAHDSIIDGRHDDILKNYGLSRYDFYVVNLWWVRKAQIADLAGDHSITQTLVDSLISDKRASSEENADAEAAGVHIGDNVHIGPNVRIGGKPAAETAENH